MRSADLTAGSDPSPALKRSRIFLWLIWVVWLPIFTPALIGLFQSHPSPQHVLAMLAGAALFFAIYLWATWRNALPLVSISSPALSAQTKRQEWLPFALLVAVSVGLVLLGRGSVADWLDPFIFTSAYVGGRLSTLKVAAAIAILTLVNVAAGRLGGFNWPALGNSVIYVVIVGFVVHFVVRTIVTSLQLRAALGESAPRRRRRRAPAHRARPARPAGAQSLTDRAQERARATPPRRFAGAGEGRDRRYRAGRAHGAARGARDSGRVPPAHPHRRATRRARDAGGCRHHL